ncbi:prepilin-type N-terminal cleavage/methylation domain-containing protein, partial [Patescibacteria group bacterium]|nr:prepilin-type N-terminal cleavage/methylation domain-containing protein [Patescibacteria group bacterium]
MTKKAFTLVEMIIAITIFTVFIGFAMSGYLVFHRAQQEVAISRSVLMESEEILSVISSAIKADAIF